MKPTSRKSWAGNLLMWSDLTLAPSRSNNGSLALVSCLSGGYKFASVLRCLGLVSLGLHTIFNTITHLLSDILFALVKILSHLFFEKRSLHAILIKKCTR